MYFFRPYVDHPRRCGEHYKEHRITKASEGSSPQMRGALQHDMKTCDIGRIIPADAGSTISRPLSLLLRQDHPRRCGEHITARPPISIGSGSSPQMRGAQHRQLGLGPAAGIIPADAGSTQYHPHSRPKCADHPRRCGEHCETDSVSLDCEGSSPQMRGALHDHIFEIKRFGIIPADAGST